MTRFELGDVVKLRSGGPDMTVRQIFGNYTLIGVSWFERDKLRERGFAPELLDLVRPRAGSVQPSFFDHPQPNEG